jgi:hypothetical protein
MHCEWQRREFACDARAKVRPRIQIWHDRHIAEYKAYM